MFNEFLTPISHLKQFFCSKIAPVALAKAVVFKLKAHRRVQINK